MSAGLLATLMPAASRAAILSEALPEPPEMIAPACPIRLPGGAVWPAMKAASGLVNLPDALSAAACFLGVAADLAHHQHAVGVGIGLKEKQCIDEAGAVDRVAADAHAGALADAQVGELPDALVGQGARAADDADATRLVDIARHDADLAGAGRDDPRAVGADQPDTGMMCLQKGDGAGHVEHGDPLGDGDDHLDAGIGRFHDRVGRERRRHEDHGGIGPGRGDRLGAGVKDRHSQRGRPAATRRDPADQVRAVSLALLRVKRAGFAGDALTDQTRVLVDQNAHESSRLLANLVNVYRCTEKE